jgi:cysteine desulfurase
MPAYLDYAATAPLRPAARRAWLAHADGPVNPASLHASGRSASAALEDARDAIAALAGAAAREVVFTSGGTEADAMALRGRSASARSRRVLVGATEHKAVLDTVRALPDAEVVILPVDATGALRLDALTEAVAEGAALVAVMAANNEVGTVNDLAAIGAICRAAGVPWHCDAVQWPATRSVAEIPADSIALSAHKLGGPVGVGALIIRGGPDLPVYTHGGGQEGGIRSGTVDVAGATAFAAAWQAAARARDEEVPRVRRLRDQLAAGVREVDPAATVRADGARLDTHLHVTFPGCEADVLLMLLDAAGVEVSTGAACSAGIPQPSHVLLAMGAGEAAARSSVRFTLGWNSKPDDVAAALEALRPALRQARRAASVAPARVAG